MFYKTEAFSSKRKSTQMGTMPVRGVNLRDDSQFLDTSSALYIYNYYVDGLAKLVKRRGVLESIVPEETDEKWVWQEWGAYDVVAYGTDIRLYNRSTSIWDTIYTGLTPEKHEGVAAGDAYFWVTNKTDGPKRIKYKMTVAYNSDYSGNNVVVVSGNITSTLTDTYINGVDSGAVGTIVDTQVDDSGSNTFVVFTVDSGEFQEGEDLEMDISSAPTVKAPRTDINQFSYYTNVTPEVVRAVSAIGTRITGVDSGATAEIVFEATDRSWFTLRDINGEFIIGEDIVGDKEVGNYFSLGSADLFGRAKVVTAEFVVDDMYGADTDRVPKAKGVNVLGQRVFLYGLTDDISATAESAIPTQDSSTGRVTTELGDDFRDSAAFVGGGLISFPQAGEANTCAQIGDIYVTYCSNGWYAWTIDVSSSGTSVYKSNTVVNSRVDAGGERGALTTPIGLCVANESGVVAYYGLGLTNVPYSKQSKLLTAQIGHEFFEDVDFSDGDMVYDERREYLYVTCAKNSAINNLVLAIRAEGSGGSESGAQGAVSFFDWPVKRFLKRSDGTLYAVFNDGSLHQLDISSDDNGAPIHTEYLQEVNFATNDLFNLEEWFWKGELSPVSSINVSFDTFDKDMYFQLNRRNYTWAPRNSYGAPSGWGASGWGNSGWGGGSSLTGLIEDKDGAKPRLRNLSRVRIRFTSDDYADHIINWMSGSVSFVRPDRKRSLPNS